MQFFNLIKNTLLGAVIFGLCALPFFMFGFLIHLWAGFGDSLDEQCQIENMHASTYAFLRHDIYWQLQVESQQRKIAALKDKSSELLEARTTGQRKIAEAIAEIRTENPELLRGGQATTEQRYAESLRQKADEVEFALAVQKEQAERKRKLAIAMRCITVARDQLNRSH